MLALSTVDRESQLGQTKLELILAASPLKTQHKGVRAKTGWMSGVTCLPTNCYFNEWSDMSTHKLLFQ